MISRTKLSACRRPSIDLLRLVLLPLAMGSIAACHDLVDPPLPSGAEAFAPPAVYQPWWTMTEACANRTGPLSAVSWYVVRGTRTISDGEGMVSAYWSAATNRIVLSEEAAQTGSLVRHEMLHAILQGGGHPRRAFLDDCGGVVSCGDACLRDAGPAPAAPLSAAVVPPESLDVSVVISPAVPTSAQYDGHFTLTVFARNTSSRFFVVSLPQGLDGVPVGFRFDVGTDGRELFYDDRVRDASVTRFAPGETKRRVFDLVVGAPGEAWAVAPGTHLVEGGFGHQWSPQVSLAISP